MLDRDPGEKVDQDPHTPPTRGQGVCPWVSKSVLFEEGHMYRTLLARSLCLQGDVKFTCGLTISYWLSAYMCLHAK